MRCFLFAALIISFSISAGIAKESQEIVVHDNLMDHGNGHLMDFEGGMVMGQNTEVLPGGCEEIAEDREITVHAGQKYSEKFPGTMFAFDHQEWRVEPCTRLTIHFINEDQIRHQYMVHGLPKYIYKAGMFHLEVPGPGKISGTFIVPGYDQTYLVHCDISQHMEKGMKAQIVAGKGGISMPSVPGLTPQIITDDYNAEELKSLGPPQSPPAAQAEIPAAAEESLISGMTIIGLAFGLLGAPVLAKRYAGMAPRAIMDDLSSLVKTITRGLVKATDAILKQASALGSKELVGAADRVKKTISDLLKWSKKSSN